ncbi:hypothetical protein L1887_43873 [Cichorium endivia]|nr:hypothetical protein L1887_43873 [Cichorium endivia]
MSYQVLARKWRPQTFADVVGQEHVLTALANGLSLGRIHHAYLFSGTPRVGKTSIARLLAKGLNCETGITATPCGVCDNCREIEQGRFVDLIEIDAASRTKVEDTRDLLDNVQYAPGARPLQDAGRAARAREVPAGDYRSAKAAGHDFVTLPAVPPEGAGR